MDAHVPQCQGVVRLSLAALRDRWPAWLLAIAWMVLLACLPWWTGLPLLLACAAIQAARLPRLQRYNRMLRRALRWGLAGLLVASYFAFGHHALGLTLTMLAALLGFSLLVLLESWQDRRPQRDAAIASASPEWPELALAPMGPPGTVIELLPPTWVSIDDGATDVTLIGTHSCRIGDGVSIDDIEPNVSTAPGQRWIALPMTAWRGVVLYDRTHARQHRLHGWQLYGWHAGEAWLSRREDQPPWPLSHVLGQDLFHE